MCIICSHDQLLAIAIIRNRERLVLLPTRRYLPAVEDDVYFAQPYIILQPLIMGLVAFLRNPHTLSNRIGHIDLEAHRSTIGIEKDIRRSSRACISSP